MPGWFSDRRVRVFFGLLLVPPISGGYANFFGGSVVGRDTAGEAVTVGAAGSTALLTAALLCVVAIDCLAGLSSEIRAKTERSPAAQFLVALTALLLAASVVRGAPPSLVFFTALALLILAYVSRVPLTQDVLRALSWCVILVGGVAAALILIFPDQATLACRLDKCSPVGYLARGPFAHENILAIYVVLTIPILAFQNGVSRWASLVIALCLVAASGSRGAGAAAILAVVVHYFVYSRRRVDVRSPLPWYLRLTPILGLIMSAYLFLFISADLSLTGRSFIFELLRQYWLDSPIFGPGRESLATAYGAGQTSGVFIAHEHGQAGYLFVNAGLIGFFLFACFVIAATRLRGHSDRGIRLSLLVAASPIFLTEPVYEMQARSPYFWALCLVAMAAPAPSRSAVRREEAPYAVHRRRDR